MLKFKFHSKTEPLIVKVGVFGSYARGEANDESDIDLIFEFKEVIGLMKLGGLIIDLEEALGKRVDVLRFCAINPQIRDHVLQEVKIIFEQGIKGEKNRVCTANGKPVCG